MTSLEDRLSEQIIARYDKLRSDTRLKNLITSDYSTDNAVHIIGIGGLLSDSTLKMSSAIHDHKGGANLVMGISEDGRQVRIGNAYYSASEIDAYLGGMYPEMNYEDQAHSGLACLDCGRELELQEESERQIEKNGFIQVACDHGNFKWNYVVLKQAKTGKLLAYRTTSSKSHEPVELHREGEGRWMVGRAGGTRQPYIAPWNFFKTGLPMKIDMSDIEIRSFPFELSYSCSNKFSLDMCDHAVKARVILGPDLSQLTEENFKEWRTYGTNVYNLMKHEDPKKYFICVDSTFLPVTKKGSTKFKNTEAKWTLPYFDESLLRPIAIDLVLSRSYDAGIEQLDSLIDRIREYRGRVALRITSFESETSTKKAVDYLLDKKIPVVFVQQKAIADYEPMSLYNTRIMLQKDGRISFQNHGQTQSYAPRNSESSDSKSYPVQLIEASDFVNEKVSFKFGSIDTNYLPEPVLEATIHTAEEKHTTGFNILTNSHEARCWDDALDAYCLGLGYFTFKKGQNFEYKIPFSISTYLY
ncbi:MAG: hypothetical protein KKF44_08240 [Nanoarchaeota archaeon]|nr:hypothetical protein [Nanoarchaeota archaeon]